jgi:hypothetical protein
MDFKTSEQAQELIAMVALAMIAGALASLSRAVDAGKKIKFPVVFLEACTSGFVGFLSALMCKSAHLDLEISGVIVGLTGWLGAAASVKIIEKIARRRLGIADENPFIAEQHTRVGDDDRTDFWRD